jgi:DNA-directed RNA polymerase subunit RPC12/RpoP
MSNENYKDTISKRASVQGIPQQNVFASINNLSQEDLRLLAESADGPFMVYLWSPIGTEAKLNAARNIGLHLNRETMKCPHCGKEVEDQAVTCVMCGTPIRGTLSAVKTKDKTVAVILAIILGLWTWCYTYKKDAWKFWLNLVLSLVSIGYWLPVAWIWAIIDASRRPTEFYINFGQSIISQTAALSTQAKVPQVQEIQNERNVGSSAIGQTSNNVPRLPSPPPWSLSTIAVILFATTLLPPIGFVVGLIALMKAKTRIIGVMFLGISIVYFITWIPFTPIGGILFCLVFTCIIVFSRPPKCENCGQTIPKVRTTFPSLRQALLGGGVCPNCGTEVDRKGRIKR